MINDEDYIYVSGNNKSKLYQNFSSDMQRNDQFEDSYKLNSL